MAKDIVLVAERAQSSPETLGRNKKHVRLSDRIDSVIMALQVVLFCRFFVLLIGLSNQSIAATLIRFTDFIVKPLYPVFSSIQIGVFILEPASAVLILILTVALTLLAIVWDSIRLNKIEVRS